MNAPATKLTLVSTQPRHAESADEAIQELEHALACLRIAKAYVTPGAIRSSFKFASVAIENAKLVIAGAIGESK